MVILLQEDRSYRKSLTITAQNFLINNCAVMIDMSETMGLCDKHPHWLLFWSRLNNPDD